VLGRCRAAHSRQQQAAWLDEYLLLPDRETPRFGVGGDNLEPEHLAPLDLPVWGSGTTVLARRFLPGDEHV